MIFRRGVGGFGSIGYTLGTAGRVGSARLLRAMASRNACKTCALGMGGQKGGMRNELGRWPEFCKKSLQAMASDLQKPVPRSFFHENPLERLRAMSPRELETAGRLASPVVLRKGESRYRPVSWEDALDRIAGKLRETPPARSFFYFSGRSSMEAGFLLQIMARAYGTNHVNNCSYYCHQASGVGLGESVGSGTATLGLDDVEKADLVFLIGANPASNHPRLLTSLMHLKRRGGKVVVINPVREPGLVKFHIPSDPASLLAGTEIADHYIQPHIGGDIALLTGIARELLESGRTDSGFIRDHTEGFDTFEARVRETPWDRIVEESGVERSRFRLLADLYAASKGAVFAWTMGITHHVHGVENVRSIVNLALLRGMVGREGAGLLPIRGHSNVQGMGTVGVTPALKDEVFRKLSEFGIEKPAMEGYDTLACMEAADRGEMDFAWCLGGNLYGSNPDQEFARRAMSRIGLIVYLSTTLNTGHAHGTGEETLILPVAARDEESQPTTQESMFNYVRLSDGGPARLEGVRSEVEVVSEVAGRLLGDRPVRWSALREHGNIRDLIARTIPGMEKLGRIDETKEEFVIPGRIHHQPRFSTPSGRARFADHGLPGRSRAPDDGVILMSIRSEGQFNTVVYEEEDLFRGQERRDVILMNPADMKRLGLRRDDRVTVRSETGALEGLLARPFEIREGNAAVYYPEANRIFPRRADPSSRTPAFKALPVRVTRALSGPR